MSLRIFISSRAEQDLTMQYRWYLENADPEVAERYLSAVNDTIGRIAEWPGLGRRRRFRAAELANIRSIQVRRPFDCHLVFFEEGDSLRIVRVIHGARDLPERLLDDPEA